MKTSAIIHSAIPHSGEAGLSIGNQALQQLGGPPDAMLLLVSCAHDYPKLLEAIHASCAPTVLIGGTVATAYTHDADLAGSVCAVVFRSNELHFQGAVTRGLSDGRAAAQNLGAALMEQKKRTSVFRTAIVLMDARAQFADTFVEELTSRTGGTIQLFGGGATDDPLVSGSHVFFNTEVLENAAVALDIQSTQALGVTVFHGWAPASGPYRVTQSEGRVLNSLNAQPAVDAFIEYAETTGQQFDPKAPAPFFLENVLGLTLPDGHKLRVPLAVLEDGSIVTATEIPEESVVQVMRLTAAHAAEAAEAAVTQLRRVPSLGKPSLAIFFDCLAARVRHQRGLGIDLRSLHERLGTDQYVAFGTAGQIARADGQFNGFHNSTSVVCIFPG